MSDRRKMAWVVALVAVFVYFPSLGNGFAYDDQAVIVRDSTLHDPGNLPELIARPYWAGSEGAAMGAWRPITTGSFSLLWATADGAPWMFHGANVILHALASALVALLATSLFTPAGGWLAGLLFAVHPVHVEAVANGIGYAEVLGTVFVLAACLALVRRPPGSRLGTGRQLAIVGFYAAAVLTKENMAVLPGLLVVLDLWRERTEWAGLGDYLRRRWILLAALSGVLLGIFLLRGMILGAAVSGYPALGAELLAEAPRIWTMAAVWLEYLRLLFWPAALSPDYTPPRILLRYGWDPVALTGLVTVLGLLGVAWWAARRDIGEAAWARAIPLGLLWFVLGMLPVANILFMTGILLAERTLYLPSVGLSLVAAGVVAALVGRHRSAVLGVSALILTLMAARSMLYMPVWANETSVFVYLANEVPESSRSHWLIAESHLHAGNDSLAIEGYRRLVPHLGNSYPFLLEAGVLLERAGYPERAAAFLRRAWWVDPNRMEPPRRLAMIANAEEDLEAVLSWTEAALETDETRVELWHLRAVAFARLDRWEESARARLRLLAQGERDVWQQWFWLAEAQLRSGSPEEVARENLDSALVRGAPGDLPNRFRAISDSVGGS